VLAPMHVENLSTQRVLQVATGIGHSACLLATQTVVTFGQNEFGQLGHSPDKLLRVPPRIVKGASKIVQVACGELHTLLLSSYVLLLARVHVPIPHGVGFVLRAGCPLQAWRSV